MTDPAFVSAKEFFDFRDLLTESVRKIDQQLATIAADSETLLSEDQSQSAPDMPERLASNGSKEGALRQLRAAAQKRLDRHDEGLQKASTNLVAAVGNIRTACIEQAKALLKAKIGPFVFALIEEIPLQHRSNALGCIDLICEGSRLVRNEDARHFGLFKWDRQMGAQFLQNVAQYFREIELCRERLAELKLMQDGQVEYTPDLRSVDSEFLAKMFGPPAKSQFTVYTLAERLAYRKRNIGVYEDKADEARSLGQSFSGIHPDDEISRSNPWFVTPEERKLVGVI